MEKEFYTIPVDYMTTGGNATKDEAGFNKEVYGEGGKASIEFVTPEIYSSTDEYYYVEKSDDGLLKSGDLSGKAGFKRALPGRTDGKADRCLQY